MNKYDLQRKREKILAELRELENTEGALRGTAATELQPDDIIDAEVVELPDPTGPESRQPAADSTNRSQENDVQGSNAGPMERSEHGNQGDERPAVCLPAVVERPGPAQYSEEWWRSSSPDIQGRRCRGHLKNGEQCHKPAIRGSTVCRTHGGAAPQVVAAARARLANAADSMASNLVGLARTAESEAVRVRATEGVLDRVGIGRTTEVEIGPVKPKPYEEIFESIGGGTRAESRARRGVEDHSGTYGYGHGSPASGLDASFLPPTEGDPRYAAGPSPDGPLDTHPADFPRERRRRRQAQSTDEEALYLARLANERSGSLPAQRAIESRHRRYPRPW